MPLAGLSGEPLFVAIVLVSTSAGLLLPLLKDAHQESTQFGQLVMTAAALAEVISILLLSLLFSAASKTSGQRVASLVIFLALLGIIGLALARVRRLDSLERLLNRLDDQSAQLRVRATLTLALVPRQSLGQANPVGLRPQPRNTGRPRQRRGALTSEGHRRRLHPGITACPGTGRWP